MPIFWVPLSFALIALAGDTTQPLLAQGGPHHGVLHATFLGSEGRPTPVMVAIRAASTGENIRFGSHRHPTRDTDTKTPNALSPRPQWSGWEPQVWGENQSTELPPGKYLLHAGKGIEFAPILSEFSVSPGETTKLTATLSRFRDMPAAGWWSGDDHVHATRSGPSHDAMILEASKAEDIHVSNVLLMGSPHGTSFLQYALGRDGRSMDGDYVIVPGQEEPRTHQLGHMLGLNIQKYVRHKNRYVLYDLVLRDLRKDGALTGFAHVRARPQKPDFATHGRGADLGVSMALAEQLLDFVEVPDSGNADRLGLYYDMLNLGYRLPMAAGSDFPYGAHIGNQRVYVFTGTGNPLSVESWFENLKQGRTFISQGPLLTFSVDGRNPGAVIEKQAGDRLEIQVRAAGHPLIGSPKTISLIQFGKVLETASSGDPQQEELAASWELAVERSAWLALRVEAHNGATAHTSPVYIEVNGQPSHDPEQVPAAAGRRITRLREMLATLSEARLRSAIASVRADSELHEWEQNERIGVLKSQISNLDAIRDRVSAAIVHYERMSKE